MKKQTIILLCILLVGFFQISVAQNAAEAVVKTKTKSNQSNDRSSTLNDESRTIRIKSTAAGCEITFNQAIVSPRDAASGLPTGKRQHKPYVITKEYDKSSPVLAKGMGTGKASMSDLSVTLTSNGRTQKLAVVNGAVKLPDDCDDDDCDLVLSWSWGESNSGSSTRCQVPVKLTLRDGLCVAIKEKATGASSN